MRIAVLTTQTGHHSFFVRELGQTHEIVGAVVEENGVKPPFEIFHPYLEDQEKFESNRFFEGNDPPLIQSQVDTTKVGGINDSNTVDSLKKWDPDLTIAFGVSRISKSILSQLPGVVLNLHGGDPEKYRGLDSHLWAIYHRDFSSLVTVLHFLTAGLDAGDVVMKSSFEILKEMPLAALRASNTELCVRMARSAASMMQNDGRLLSSPQRNTGRYYSFMPSVMKGIVVDRFAKFTNRL